MRATATPASPSLLTSVSVMPDAGVDDNHLLATFQNVAHQFKDGDDLGVHVGEHLGTAMTEASRIGADVAEICALLSGADQRVAGADVGAIGEVTIEDGLLTAHGHTNVSDLGFDVIRTAFLLADEGKVGLDEFQQTRRAADDGRVLDTGAAPFLVPGPVHILLRHVTFLCQECGGEPAQVFPCVRPCGIAEPALIPIPAQQSNP